MSGVAGQALGISTFAKMVWCITARSSVVTQAFRSKVTQWTTSVANIERRRAARRTAPFRASIKSRCWIAGALRSGLQPHLREASCRLNSLGCSPLFPAYSLDSPSAATPVPGTPHCNQNC
jgi:hypothetical protein